MNSILSSIKENVNSRLKNPIIGAFVFAWVCLHIKGVGIFILVDNSMRIDILKNKDWLFWNDLLLPFMLSIAYLTLLPMANLAYDKFHSGWLIPKRLAISKKKTIAQIHADPDYIKNHENNKLTNLIESRTIILNTSKELSDFVSKFSNELSKADEENYFKLKSIADNLAEVETHIR